MADSTVTIKLVGAWDDEGGLFRRYMAFWSAHDANSFFRSPEHLRMIGELTGSRVGFVVLNQNGQDVAMLPFAMSEGPHGNVINSLPYYGSCSAVIGRNDAATAQSLCEALLDYACSQRVAAVTLVDDWRSHSFAGLQGADFVTQRTNQFIDLTRFRGRDPLDSYHQKTRNLVRKAEKKGVVVRLSTATADIDGLESAHRENMAAVNGIPKPELFFEMLRKPERPLGCANLYVASLNGRDCAYLLNFYCGDTVEYYMPTVYAADRASQPLSLLIHCAICEAVDNGFAFWNFGGTWPTQDSLRHFKIRWGSEETGYSYFTYVLDHSILGHTASEILGGYPHFYVAPFDQLRRPPSTNVGGRT